MELTLSLPLGEPGSSLKPRPTTKSTAAISIPYAKMVLERPPPDTQIYDVPFLPLPSIIPIIPSAEWMNQQPIQHLLCVRPPSVPIIIVVAMPTISREEKEAHHHCIHARTTTASMLVSLARTHSTRRCTPPPQEILSSVKENFAPFPSLAKVARPMTLATAHHDPSPPDPIPSRLTLTPGARTAPTHEAGKTRPSRNRCQTHCLSCPVLS
ncbi:hypothetical protein QBC39DRAFT_112138 [Podospora conica]|nr:hypothetical protein QBC39DRAFT_112138 [Schizothecium conicum]